VDVKVTIVCRTDCLVCQEEFFDVKENDKHALDFAFFGLGEVGLSMFSS
jgi:hypothetical protein